MWSYKKPTEPGLYYVNRGDVVTKETLEVIWFTKAKDEEFLSDNFRVPVKEYNDCFKFKPIDYERLNAIGNVVEVELVE